MAAIPTAPNEIDRKLHRILLESNSAVFTDMSALARSVQRERCPEFSYSRGGRKEFSGAETIHRYVSLAKSVGLLDGNLASNRPKKDIRALEEFQQWLGDTVVQYLDDSGCAVELIQDKALDLVSGHTPSKLPTPRNVFDSIKPRLTYDVFRLSIRIVSRLRPAVLEVTSRRGILIPKSVEA